jgi:lipopolysaccharide transport system ATP-binding protein
MYVRLAFAVAAHLEPEILIVDEVLAVGDAEFQKKCLGKMQDVSSKEGRTVLFVSHNLAAVKQLCTTGIFLENGIVKMKDTVNAVADHYLQVMLVPRVDQFKASGTGYTGVRTVDSEGQTVAAILSDQTVFVELGVRVTQGADVQCGFTIFNQIDVPIVLCTSEYGGADLETGEHRFRVRLPTELLQPGTYRIEGAVWDATQVFHQNDYFCHFQVIAARPHELHGRSSSAHFVSREPWLSVSAKELQIGQQPPMHLPANHLDQAT